jgi:vancomycin resistance protein YoaR
VCVLAAAGVLLVWTGAYAAAGSGVPRGTTVLGVPIGGLDRDAAQDRLREELADESTAPVPVTVGDDKFEIDPRRAGLSIDVAATVDRAEGRTWNPAGLWRALTGGGELAPSVKADRSKLDAAVAALAEKADRTPRDGDVKFDKASVTLVEPRPGRTLDQEESAQAVLEAYLRTVEPIELPAKRTTPKVGAEAAQRALEDFARPAVAAPVQLVLDDHRVDITPDQLGAVLSMKADKGRLVPQLDAKALKKALEPKLAKIETKPRNATIKIADGKPKVVAGKDGRTVDEAALGQGVLAVLPRHGERVARVELVKQEPERTTAEVDKLGIKEVVGEFTTHYPYAPYRVTNIGRAAQKINGTLLAPGDTFSLNGIVGERTAANGFAEGTIIKNGRFATELGGGVSQVATTVFNAMFFAGLKDVEHKPHSFYISRYPEGREATVAWPVLDLAFQNDSPYGVLVQTVHTTGTLTVRMWSTKVYDIDAAKSPRTRIRTGTTKYDPSPTCVPQSGVPGFDVTVTRIFNKDGKEVKREKFFTRYNPADTVHCRPEPKKAEPKKTAKPDTATADKSDKPDKKKTDG